MLIEVIKSFNINLDCMQVVCEKGAVEINLY